MHRCTRFALRRLLPALLVVAAGACAVHAPGPAPSMAGAPERAAGVVPPATPALAPRGVLLVGNKAADTVWRIDLADGTRLGKVPSGIGPHEIAVSPDAALAVVTDYGREPAGNSLTVLDLAGDAAPRRIDLGRHGRPHGLRWLPDGRRVLVTTEGSDALVVVDVAAGRVERAIDVGPGKAHMVALSADGQVAYVSKVEAGTIRRIALSADGDGAPAADVVAGGGAEGIAVAADGTVWVTNRGDGTVTLHDPDSLAVIATLPSAGFPIRIVFTPDGRHALVSNARAGTLAVFDAAHRVPVATVDVAPAGVQPRETMLGRAALPIGIAVHPDGSRAYVAVSGTDRIAVVDTATWRVVDHWVTGREPDALAIVPAGG